MVQLRARIMMQQMTQQSIHRGTAGTCVHIYFGEVREGLKPFLQKGATLAPFEGKVQN